MTLNEIQVILVEKELKQKGLNYYPLEDEFIDHICCRVEEHIQRGASFEEAMQLVLQQIDQAHLKNLQRKTRLAVYGTHTIMKKLTFATASLAACGIMITSVIQAQQMPSTAPLEKVEITSGFGMTTHPSKKAQVLHKGVDLKASMGTPVMVTADGKVIEVADDPKGYGKYILVDHGSQIITKYAQLSKFLVEVDTKVEQGQVIGLVGSSGASSAPHLHYEVLKDQQPVDPEEYMPAVQE